MKGDFWLGELKPTLSNLKLLSFLQRGKKLRLIIFKKPCQVDKNEGDKLGKFENFKFFSRDNGLIAKVIY